MKQYLAFALLVVLISSVTMHARRHRDYPPLNSKWTLKFDSANRDGVSLESNEFQVEFNGKLVKYFKVLDYDVHQQQLTVRSKLGVNRLSFKGQGNSDGQGQTIDNVKLKRYSFCGWDNAIINGGFQEGHGPIPTWSFFANNKIPGWNTVDNELELGSGKFFNKKWPEGTTVCELDAGRNSEVYQEFDLDQWNRLPDRETD